MNITKHLLAFGLLSILGVKVTGQFVTDVVTGSTIGDPQDLLYLTSPSSPENRSPVGTELWFVSDGGTLGVPTGQVSKPEIDAIAAGSADDKLFASAFVDGTDSIVNAPGRFLQYNLNYPASDQGKPVYVYLWSDSHGGDVSDTFGLLELTVANGRIIVPSGLGNFEFHINSAVFADSFSVVPEPATYATVVGFFCLGGALLRARFRNRVR